MKMDTKTVAVVGLGYVGLPLALLATKNGYLVVGIDNNKEKVELINNRISPFTDSKISKDLKETNISATCDFKKIQTVETIIICVPTPVYENRTPNYEPVINACKSIAPNLQKGQLVVLESTVNPGTCEEVVIPILEEISKLKCGTDFYLAHCPERINLGDSKWAIHNIPRVVGGFNDKSKNRAQEFYESIVSAKITPMESLKEAEAVKIVENSFRNVNIAFVNELAMSFDRLGINVVNVINGAATKPFSFMAHYPGCGIGGHCIPVDPYYLIDYAQKNNGFSHEFLTLACKTNEKMPSFTVDLLEEGLKNIGLELAKTKIAVLGLAYKGNIDDCRESPALEIIEELKNRGGIVSTFDPYVLGKSSVKTLDEALEGAQGLIVATSHDQFKTIDPKYLSSKGMRVVIDGRNFLPKDKYTEAGIYYKGIGVSG